MLNIYQVEHRTTTTSKEVIRTDLQFVLQQCEGVPDVLHVVDSCAQLLGVLHVTLVCGQRAEALLKQVHVVVSCPGHGLRETDDTNLKHEFIMYSHLYFTIQETGLGENTGENYFALP